MNKATWQSLESTYWQAMNLGETERESFVRSSVLGKQVQDYLMELLKVSQHQTDLLANIIDSEFKSTRTVNDFLNKKFGVYRITELLGEGGMGMVYLAEREDQTFQQSVAIKIIRADRVDERTIQLFQEERQTLARLNHPNICHLYDGGKTEDGHLYCVMEYIQGRALHEYCQAEAKSERDTLKLFLQVLDTLRAVHQSFVIHCDIKPNNIMVTSGGAIKLLDFGVARMVEDSKSQSQDNDHPKAISMGYSAPEIVREGRYTIACDIYSLGVLLEELLIKKPKYDYLTQKPTKPLHPQLLAVINKARSYNPIDRYSSVDSMANDLHAYLSKRPVSAIKPTLSFLILSWMQRQVALKLSFVLACLLAIIWGTREVSLRKEAERQAELNASISDIMVDMFHQADPAARGANSLLAIDLLDAGAQKIASEQSIPADLRLKLDKALAKSYSGIGAYNKAETILKKNIAALENSSMHFARRETPIQLAYFYALRAENARRNKEESENAERWFKYSLALWEKLPKDAIYYETLGLYADFLIDAYRTSDAQDVINLLLNFCEENQNFPETTCAYAHRHQAVVYLNTQRRNDAIESFKFALSLIEKSFGKKNLNYLKINSSYLGMLRFLNMHEGLQEKMQENIALVKSYYPAGHPYRNKVMSLYARYNADLSRFDEALSTFKAMNSELESAGLKGTYSYAVNKSNIAFIHYDSENYSEALAWFNESLVSMSELYASHHKIVAYAEHQVGNALVQLERPNQAIPHLMKALKVREKNTDDPMSVALTQERLARANLQLGNLAVAKQHMSTAWRFAKGEFVENDFRKAVFHETEALISETIGNRESMESHINEALNLVANGRNKTHPFYNRLLVRKFELLGVVKADLDVIDNLLLTIKSYAPPSAPSLRTAEKLRAQLLP